MSEDELKDALNSFTEALEELQDNLSTDDGSKPLDADDKVPTNPSNRNQDDGDGSTDQTPLSEKVYASKSKNSPVPDPLIDDRQNKFSKPNE